MSILNNITQTSQRVYTGEKPGEKLAQWLNDPPGTISWIPDHRDYVEKLLVDAQVVFRLLEDCRSLHELKDVLKEKGSDAEFMESYERLNKELSTFTHAPEINLSEFFDGSRVSWNMVTTEKIALVGPQVRCLLQLIERGAILSIRRCQECTKWYFARFSHQEFCATSCRRKNLAKTETFKQKQRDYMRDYYRRKKSGKE